MSLKRCVSVLVVVYIYNQNKEVDSLSPTSLKRSVSVSVVGLHWGGSATNGAILYVFLLYCIFVLLYCKEAEQ